MAQFLIESEARSIRAWTSGVSRPSSLWRALDLAPKLERVSREGIPGFRAGFLVSGLAYVLLGLGAFAMVLVGHKSPDTRIGLTVVGLLFFMYSGLRFWLWRKGVWSAESKDHSHT